MSIDTTPYTEFVQRGQDAVRTAVDTWTRTLSTVTGQMPAFPTQADVEAAVERYFDLNEKFLGGQRDFAKKVVGYATAAGAALAEKAGSATEAAVEATTKATSKAATASKTTKVTKAATA
jgi:hypothetical protein